MSRSKQRKRRFLNIQKTFQDASRQGRIMNQTADEFNQNMMILIVDMDPGLADRIMRIVNGYDL